MDWDEVLPKPGKAVTVGEDLKVLSVGELEERIRVLEKEIGGQERATGQMGS